MVFPPKGAITTKEDLENIIVLGLPVEIWDLDMNQIYQNTPLNITTTGRGYLVEFSGTKTKLYLRWFGIEDPTYDALGVVQSVPDSQLDKVNIYPASMYMFNTRQEATAAWEAHKKKVRDDFEQRRKSYYGP